MDTLPASKSWFDGDTAGRLGLRVAGLGAGAGAAFIAAHHPLWPRAALLIAAALALAQWRWPRFWIVAVPAGLPLLSLAPWTGWVVFDEFDIAVLSLLAGACVRWSRTTQVPGDRAWPALAALLGVLTLVSLARGVADAGGWSFDWHADHLHPLNAWRLGKPTLYALLFVPLLRRAMQEAPAPTVKRLLQGMVAGAATAAAAATWERAAYPGLLDASQPYRTVAWFWEMHVGGAAIDAYLAMAAPFVAWAVWASRRPWAWAASAALTVAFLYASLTTFSRGTYLGVSAALGVLAAVVAFGHLRRLEPRMRWRTLATAGLLVVLTAEAAAVLGPGSFMWGRLARTADDYQRRLEHWRRGLDLLQTPGDWLLGIGLGRLPARYAALGPAGEFSGRAQWLARGEGPSGGALRLSGPDSRENLGGLHAITQRVPLRGAYTARFHARAEHPASVQVRVCEQHLLYEERCQSALMPLDATGDAWRLVETRLEGPDLSVPDGPLPRSGVLAVSTLDAGATVDIDGMALTDAAGVDVAANGNFEAGLQRWYPAAQFHFLPWHIDNLALEILIERGVAGLAVFAGLFFLAFRSLGQAATRLASPAIFGASLVGGLVVGLSSSVLDMPRPAFLLQWLAFVSMTCMPWPTGLQDVGKLPDPKS